MCKDVLHDVLQYDPNTIDINNDRGELEYWVGVLQNQIPDVVEKAFTSEGGTKGEYQENHRPFLFRINATYDAPGLQEFD